MDEIEIKILKHLLADISKAENELKYKPGYNLDNGLKETIWYFKGRGDEIATT